MAEVESVWTRVELRGGIVRMHARAARPPEPVGPPVVVVQGPLRSPGFGEPLLEDLGALFDVFAPAQLAAGSAGAARPPGGVESMAEMLARWMEAAGLGEASLVAGSLGCPIALTCALRYPHRVRRLVLHGPSRASGAPARRQVVRALGAALREPRVGALAARDCAREGARRSLAALRAVLGPPLLPMAAQVTQPALIVSGDGEARASVELAERLAAAMPRAEHIVSRSDEPAALADASAHFLAEGEDAAAPGALRPQGLPRPPRPTPPPPCAAPDDPAMRLVAGASAALAGAHPPRARPARRRRRRSLALSAEALGDHVASHYPQRSYSAVVLGPPIGASAYLAAALGAPWLPQSFLSPAAPPGGAGDPVAAAAWGREVAADALAREPCVELRHVASASSPPRLLVALCELPSAYLRVLCEWLAPGGALVVLECRQRWPNVRLGERHLVQLGGPGTPGPWSRRAPAARALASLRPRIGRAYGMPAPDVIDAPEARFGIDPALADAARSVVGALGARAVTLSFSDPAALSLYAAETLARWYEREGVEPMHLVGQLGPAAFPRWAERAAAVPFAVPALTPSAARAFGRLTRARAWKAIAGAGDGEAWGAWREAAADARVVAVAQRPGGDLLTGLRRFAPERRRLAARLSVGDAIACARAIRAEVRVREPGTRERPAS